MGFCSNFLAISFGWSLLFCDATVTVSLLNRANGVDTLECRSDGVVSCRINPYSGLMNWVISGTAYAICSPGCAENPSIIRNYSPTYDVANGVFNLTVDRATFNDNSTTFQCDDGVFSDEITIEVVPAYSENKTSINETDEGNQVEFTTACVQPDVEFEWFSVKTDNSDRKTYNKGQNENTETTICSNDSECGGVGTGKVSSVITIPTVSKGEERYIEVVVKYKNPDEERTFRFNQIFFIEDCELRCSIIILLIYFVRLILMMVLFFAGCACALWKISLENSVLVCIGNIPVLGPCCSAFLLFYKLKETYCRIFLTFVACSWFTDIYIFVVMILHCTDILKTQCFVYAVYAWVTLLFPLMNFRCLKLYQKRHTDSIVFFSNLRMIGKNKVEIESKPLCGKCKQHQTAKTKCDRCVDYVFGKLRHMKNHEEQNATDAIVHVSGMNSNCSHNEKTVESYCLTCEQYLCELCINNHAEHRILRHSQQGADNEGYRIFCKFCQNKGIEADAKYYGKCVKSFVCENCNALRNLTSSIAVEDPKWQCKRCEDNEDNTISPVECNCLIYDENMCAVCYEKQEEINHHCYIRKGRKASLQSHADVLCLVCNEYLCKMCFTQHLNIKQLWLQQHPRQANQQNHNPSPPPPTD